MAAELSTYELQITKEILEQLEIFNVLKKEYPNQPAQMEAFIKEYGKYFTQLFKLISDVF